MAADATPPPCRTIGDHGIVGNLETAALVAADGTIDFLCWPRLDSPSVFAALLDPDQGGAFTLAPALEEARTVQFYLPETNVLQTRWLSQDASVELTDWMPHPEAHGVAHRRLVRRLQSTRGTVRIAMRCDPRFDYACARPAVTRDGDAVVFTGPDGIRLRLAGSVPIDSEDGVGADFDLAEGQTVWFALDDGEGPVPDDAACGRTLDRTVAQWRAWVRRSDYRGRWREEVTRSALALKLLTSHAHGSIAAAATFGLPEATGEGRNWDYRATWIRDGSFTIYAFLRLGHVEEAERFREWLFGCDVMREDTPELKVMYALDGGEAADETTLDHLSGYAGSRPVRIGNAARGQRQLDIYGELMDGIYLANKYGRAISHDGWRKVVGIVDHVCDHWQEADAGIWEMRGEERHFAHSRLMCWVAIDRALRLAHKRSLDAPLTRWREERARISEDLWTRFRHPEHGYFVQDRGGTQLDAALLMMPLLRFVSATDPVWLRTLDAIGDELADDGMVYRYCNSDGLTGGEGAFTACTFWYIECLARAGRLDAAQVMMAKALRYANHLGLFSEELDRMARPLGNFPQALTHLAFISAAYFLNGRLDDPKGGQWQP